MHLQSHQGRTVGNWPNSLHPSQWSPSQFFWAAFQSPHPTPPLRPAATSPHPHQILSLLIKRHHQGSHRCSSPGTCQMPGVPGIQGSCPKRMLSEWQVKTCPQVITRLRTTRYKVAHKSKEEYRGQRNLWAFRKAVGNTLQERDPKEDQPRVLMVMR